MSQPRLAAVAILGLTTITAAGLAYHQFKRAENLSELLAEAKLERQALAALKTSDERRPAFDDDGSSRPAEVEPTEVAAIPEVDETDAGPSDQQRRSMRNSWNQRFQELMDDPTFARAFQLQQRSRLDSRYADLFAQLNLPPATLAKLQALLIERQNTTRDVFLAAREEGFGRGDGQQLRELVDITQQEIDAEIRATIGEQNFAQFEQYQQTGRQRQLVGQLESRLSYTATPLNAAQSQALTTILADTSVSGDRGRGTAIISEDALVRAQAVLAPDQLAALTALQEEQAAAQTISAAMRNQARPAREQLERGTASAAPRPGGG